MTLLNRLEGCKGFDDLPGYHTFKKSSLKITGFALALLAFSGLQYAMWKYTHVGPKNVRVFAQKVTIAAQVVFGVLALGAFGCYLNSKAIRTKSSEV